MKGGTDMAKICKQCNLKYKNRAVTCVSCGSELSMIESTFRIRWSLIYTAIALVLVLATTLSVSYFTSPKAAVKKILKAYKGNDVETVVDSFPPFLNYATGLDREALEEYMEKSVKDLSDYITFYHVEDVKKPSSNEREEVLETLSYYKDFGYDEDKLEDIKLVWAGMRGGPVGTCNFTNERFVMIKYDGHWYWWPK